MWTAAHQQLLDAYAGRLGLPALDSEAARQWTWNLAEQFAFAFPAEGWGTKQADAGRPQSTDCICTKTPFLGYDVLISQGASNQHLAVNPAAIDLTNSGQIYLAVDAEDHLSGAGGVYAYPDENTDGKAFQDRVAATYTEAKRKFPDPLDPDAFRHFMRYGYSSHEMPEPDAADKHIAELRSDLKLPAV